MKIPLAKAHFALVAASTLIVLTLTLESQMFDTNFYTLWEATAILAGDHPYRDFFEWGVPMQAAFSTVAQLLVGNRLIGEFLIHWTFIVAGVTIAFHLSLWLSRSTVASLLTTIIALVLLAATPTFHYPKLFFYPLAIWLCWRYMDRPTAMRAAMLGVATATAFLFRHDHGVYVGIAVILTFLLARLAVPSSRDLPSLVRDGISYGGILIALIGPWALFVHRSEGLAEYVTSRAQLYGAISSHTAAFRFPAHLFAVDRARPLIQTSSTDYDPYLKADLDQFLKTNPGDEARAAEALNITREQADAILRGATELPARPVLQIAPGVVTRNNALVWIFEVIVLMPVVALAVLGWHAIRGALHATVTLADACRLLLVAIFLIIVEARILREESYVLLVAPLTGVLGSWLFVAAMSGRSRHRVPFDSRALLALSWTAARRVLAIGIVFVTATAATVFAKTSETGLFELANFRRTAPDIVETLIVSPPIDGYVPPDSPERNERTMWERPINEKYPLVIRYIYECTRPNDRLLVLGSTPYDVGYYTQRRIAGGHLFWKEAWRSDPKHEQQSLAMLQRQSVPFAFSSTGAVLEVMSPYPRIREYLLENYTELTGTDGRVLVDKRRQRTGTFDPFDLPCYR